MTPLFLALLFAAPELQLVPQVGHTAGVARLSFDGSGKRLASCDFASVCKVWDVASGRLLESRTVGSNAYLTQDGLRVVGSGYGALTVATLGGDVLRIEAKGLTPAALPASLSLDGRVFAAPYMSDTVWIVDTASGDVKKLPSVTGRSALPDMDLVALSPDGRLLAVAPFAGGLKEIKIRLFDTKSGAPAGELVTDVPIVSSMAMREGALLWTGGNQLYVHDLATKSTEKIKLPTIGAEKVTPDGKLVVIPDVEGNVTIWDIATRKTIAVIAVPKEMFTAVQVAVAPDRRTAAISTQAGVNSGSVELVDMQDTKQRRALGGSAREVTDARFTAAGVALTAGGAWQQLELPTGKTIGYADLSGTTQPYPARDGRLLAVDPRKTITLLAPNGARLWSMAAGDFMGPTKIDATSKRFIISRIETEKSPPYSSKWFTKLVELADGKDVREVPGYGLAIADGGELFATKGDDDVVRLWGAKGDPVATARSFKDVPGAGVTFDAAGAWLGLCGGGTCDVVGAATGAVKLTLKDAYWFRFSPDGKHVATGKGSEAGRIVALETGAVVRPLNGGAIDFLDRGKLIAVIEPRKTGAMDTALYRVADGGLVARIDGTLVGGADAVSADGKLALTVLDGCVAIWSLDEKSPRLLGKRVMGSAGSWLVSNAAGQFDLSSPDSRGLLGWRSGGEVLGPDQFFEVGYTPGLLERAVAGKLPSIASLASETPPAVSISAPPTGDVGGEVEVKVEAVDRGSGVKDVRLYHQGKLVEQAAERGVKAVAAKSSGSTFKVVLLGGDNAFRAVAFSKGGVESQPAEVVVAATGGKVATSSLYVLVVGINDYEVADFKLRVARPDAEAVAAAIEAGAKPLFQTVSVKRVLDREASRKGILDALAGVAAAAKPQDVVVLFLSGHGDTDPDSGRYSFLPADFRFKGLDSLETSGIPQKVLSEALQKIEARKLLVLLDTCKSGQLAKALGPMLATRGVAEQRALAVLARASGVAVAAASTDRQSALEDTGLGHGIFTHAVLEALSRSGGPVTVASLLAHIEQEVPKLSEAKYKRLQDPIVARSGQDFPLVSR